MRRPARLVPPLAALLGLLLFPLSGSSYFTSVLIVIALHTIVAVGLALLLGYTGQVSLGQGGFYGLGAYTSAILTVHLSWDPWPALIVAAALTAAIAYVVALPVFKLRGHYLAVATLGFGIIVYVVLVEAHDLTGGPNGLPGIPHFSLLGFAFDTDFRFYYLALGACLAALVVAAGLVDSRVGRAMRAIRGSESAAASLGIDVVGFKRKVFVISALYAALAGSLYASWVTFVSPQPFSFVFSVRLLVMVVVGGFGHVWGALFGTTFVTVLSQLLQGLGNYEVMGFGLLLMAVMILTPSGLPDGVARLARRFRRPPAPAPVGRAAGPPIAAGGE